MTEYTSAKTGEYLSGTPIVKTARIQWPPFSAKIRSDIYLSTLSVPQRSQFSTSFTLGKLLAIRLFGTDNVRGHLSIFSLPERRPCLTREIQI